jgi:hypothetical protein
MYESTRRPIHTPLAIEESYQKCVGRIWLSDDVIALDFGDDDASRFFLLFGIVFFIGSISTNSVVVTR